MMSAETLHTDLENKKVAASRMESGKRLNEVIFEQQFKLWRTGGAELEFVFACFGGGISFFTREPSLVEHCSQ